MRKQSIRFEERAFGAGTSNTFQCGIFDMLSVWKCDLLHLLLCPEEGFGPSHWNRETVKVPAFKSVKLLFGERKSFDHYRYTVLSHLMQLLRRSEIHRKQSRWNVEVRDLTPNAVSFNGNITAQIYLIERFAFQSSPFSVANCEKQKHSNIRTYIPKDQKAAQNPILWHCLTIRYISLIIIIIIIMKKI